MPKPTRSHITARTGIRPSLWIAAAVVAGGVIAVIAAVNHDEPRDARAEAERSEREDEPNRASSRSGGDRRVAARGSSRRARSGGAYEHHDWSTESELSRRIALGLPQSGFWEQPYDQVREQDPQLAAMWRSFQDLRAPDSEAPPLPFEPIAHRAQLIDSEGEVASNPSSCDVRVLPVQTGQFNCVVRVTCDGTTLYPHDGQDAGYVPCDVENGRAVRALDDGGTDSDGDPLVDLDLAAGTVTVEDYAPDGQRRYRATLRINS